MDNKVINDSVKTHSFAILDETTRGQKAKKIELLVRKYASLRMGDMLEIGTGSGFIISYFSKLGYGEKGSFAVDVIDERQVTDGFHFQLVEETALPFPDNKFDFIISNHVIEHVGDIASQENHLKEIYRILKPDGVFYFAVPNRFRFFESHYKLPFLSWLPNSISSLYVRWAKRGKNYDCKPISRKDAVSLLSKQGFTYTEVTLDAIRLIGEIEGGNTFKKFITGLPKRFWRILLPFMPTLIYICRKPAS